MKIETQDWDYTCSDGCCYEYGVYLWIDGKEVDECFCNREQAFEYILENVFNCEVDYRDEE